MWQRGERLEQVPVAANELAEVVALSVRDLFQERGRGGQGNLL